MTYSYTQISQYLRCPRAYRYRYLDGWRERDTRASLLFGRAFEKALGAFFTGEDSSAALFKQWEAHREAQLEYSKGDNWERMFRQGVQLLERLAQDDRIQIHQPLENMQVKLIRSLPAGNDFVSYLDAVGTLRRQALSPGMEDHHGTVSGRTRWTIGARSSAYLLFLDQRDFRRGRCSLCSQTRF